MIAKLELKERAIALRKEGKTYSEIRKQIPVAKSTLSLWFIDVGIGKKQKQRITQKRIEGQLRGARRRREQRLEITKEIFKSAKRDVTSVSKRVLWLIGIMLYWAEGSKQKVWNVSTGVLFSNSDHIMIKLFIHWLIESIKVEAKDIQLSLYIHENNKFRLGEVIDFWHQQTGNRWEISDRVYFKHHNPSPNRHNLGKEYYGTLRVSVRASTNLNRRITGWVNALCEICRVV